jgi:hypothetical protein
MGFDAADIGDSGRGDAATSEALGGTTGIVLLALGSERVAAAAIVGWSRAVGSGLATTGKGESWGTGTGQTDGGTVAAGSRAAIAGDSNSNGARTGSGKGQMMGMAGSIDRA